MLRQVVQLLFTILFCGFNGIVSGALFAAKISALTNKEPISKKALNVWSIVLIIYWFAIGFGGGLLANLVTSLIFGEMTIIWG